MISIFVNHHTNLVWASVFGAERVKRGSDPSVGHTHTHTTQCFIDLAEVWENQTAGVARDNGSCVLPVPTLHVWLFQRIMGSWGVLWEGLLGVWTVSGTEKLCVLFKFQVLKSELVSIVLLEDKPKENNSILLYWNYKNSFDPEYLFKSTDLKHKVQQCKTKKYIHIPTVQHTVII